MVGEMLAALKPEEKPHGSTCGMASRAESPGPGKPLRARLVRDRKPS